MPFVRGTELNCTDRNHVLAAYIHRFTGNHMPAWAKRPMSTGAAYPLQFASDDEWLANTLFLVTKAGRLEMTVKECESHPTWPNNPELRGPKLIGTFPEE